MVTHAEATPRLRGARQDLLTPDVGWYDTYYEFTIGSMPRDNWRLSRRQDSRRSSRLEKTRAFPNCHTLTLDRVPWLGLGVLGYLWPSGLEDASERFAGRPAGRDGGGAEAAVETAAGASSSQRLASAARFVGGGGGGEGHRSTAAEQRRDGGGDAASGLGGRVGMTRPRRRQGCREDERDRGWGREKQRELLISNPTIGKKILRDG
jgi:hypothetical protein